jgi:hypothetical protein
MLIEEIEKKCTICGEKFFTRNERKRLCNNFECKQIYARQRALIYSRRKRENREKPNCEICGFNEVIDCYHEFGKMFYLCPNHRNIITRNKKSIKDLLITCELRFKKMLIKKIGK